MKSAQSILQALSVEASERGCFYGSETPDWHGPKIGAKLTKTLTSYSPADGSALGEIALGGSEEYHACVHAALQSFQRWQTVPAPKRGELVYEIGRELRNKREELGALISWEMGKILPEGIGEVQEAIDIADFAVGLSRQLYGKTMHSERPAHRMYEQWHPLGPVAVITAFNFPVAVWAWNTMIALVCGNSVIWKPSELTPLTSIALTKLVAKVCNDFNQPGLVSLLIDDDASYGKLLSNDKRIPLVSATGSCAMGRAVGAQVAKRLGRSLLELGGNNAVIVSDDADIDLALRAVVFGAVGTAGQRCTTTRRLFVLPKIYDTFRKRLIEAYQQVRIGHPLEEGTLCGPLINRNAVEAYSRTLALCKEQGAKILSGGAVVSGLPSEYYVEPCIVEVTSQIPIMCEETFAPILYLLKTNSLEEALELHNAVPQGLSSAIFTKGLSGAEQFLSAVGSDCGIANVNIGTSGAEIGGAFGGEKDTGGGREAGSDSWKAYMRRQTNTINWGKELPLAQGIRFE